MTKRKIKLRRLWKSYRKAECPIQNRECRDAFGCGFYEGLAVAAQLLKEQAEEIHKQLVEYYQNPNDND